MAKKITKKPKNKMGRKRIYNSPETLQKKIDEYFSNPPKKTIFVNGVPIDMPIPTVTGLALFLGFCDRQSMRDYKEYPEFSCTIKKAITRIENHYEELLQSGSPTGAIFALKNFGWKDKFEQEITGNLNVSNMSDEELKSMLPEAIKLLKGGN